MRKCFAAAAVFATLAMAGGATAEVLIDSPRESGCLGHSIRVGVSWDEATQDRSFRVQIFDVEGRIVLLRAGEATQRWQIWSYVPRNTGTFRTVYETASGTTTFETRIVESGCFRGNVAGSGSGPRHRFVVGDGLYLNFRDDGVDRNAAYGTPYRVCWRRLEGDGSRCWSRRTSAVSHTSRIFTPAPQRTGSYVVRWYVGDRLVATWRFRNGVGD